MSSAIRLGGICLAFLFFMVLARNMTPEGFGVFSMLYALATTVSYVANIGQHVAILRFWPALDEAHGRGVAAQAVRRGLGLTLAGGCIGALIIASLGLFPLVADRFAAPANLAWSGLLVLAIASSVFAESALRAQGWLVFALAPRDILWRLVVIIIAVLAAKPLGASDALAAVALVLLVLCLPQIAVLIAGVRRARHVELPRAERERMRRATWGLWASSSITPIMDHVTTILVGLTLGPMAAGAYFAADRLAKLLNIALVGIEQIAAPMLARSYHAGRHDEVAIIASTSSAMAFAIALAGALAFLVLGRFALSLFNPHYADVLPVLLILAAGQLVNTACGPNCLLLDMAGRERDLLAIRAVWGLISLLAVPLAALHLGMVGAAIASTAVMAGWNICAVAICRIRLGISPVFFIVPGSSTLASGAVFVWGKKP